MRVTRFCLLTLAVTLTLAPPLARAGAMPVDVALGLGLDVSGSTNRGEFELMVNGIADAFRSAAVQNAIGSGPNGQIAVSLYMWNSQGQDLDIPWTMVSSSSADAFADQVADLLLASSSETFDTSAGMVTLVPSQFNLAEFLEPIFFQVMDDGAGNIGFLVGGGSGNGFGQTAVVDAIDFGVTLFDDLGDFDPLRRVLDISGDGFENVMFDAAGCAPAAGDPPDICQNMGNVFDPLTSRIFDPETYFRFVSDARDAAVAAGITVNGLPILTDVSDLDPNFYSLALIGGPGAFSNPSGSFEDFGTAISAKLQAEIVPEPQALLLLGMALGAVVLRRRS